jgi:hypothetical protein
MYQVKETPPFSGRFWPSMRPQNPAPPALANGPRSSAPTPAPPPSRPSPTPRGSQATPRASPSCCGISSPSAAVFLARPLRGCAVCHAGLQLAFFARLRASGRGETAAARAAGRRCACLEGTGWRSNIPHSPPPLARGRGERGSTAAARVAQAFVQTRVALPRGGQKLAGFL